MVGVAGFEPTTLCPPDKCATRLRYTPTGALSSRNLVMWQPSGSGEISRLAGSLPFPAWRLFVVPEATKWRSRDCYEECVKEQKMNGIIYLVGLVVVILAVLSFFGLR